MSQEALDQLRAERRAQAAQERFVARLAEGFPVVRVPHVRCPGCGCVAQGRPIRSQRDGELSVQERKCHLCGERFYSVRD
jgi:hypothetical protein